MKKMNKSKYTENNNMKSSIAEGAKIINSEVARGAKIEGATVAGDAKIINSRIAEGAEIKGSKIAKNAEIINSTIAKNARIKSQLKKVVFIPSKYAIIVLAFSIIVLIVFTLFATDMIGAEFISTIVGFGGLWALLNLLFNVFRSLFKKVD